MLTSAAFLVALSLFYTAITAQPQTEVSTAIGTAAPPGSTDSGSSSSSGSNHLGVVGESFQQAALLDQICNAARSGPVDFSSLGLTGEDVWAQLGLDQTLLAYFQTHDLSNWVDFFYGFSVEAKLGPGDPSRLVCYNPEDPCEPTLDCSAYDTKQAAIVSWAIKSLHGIISAEAAAYDDALTFLTNNDNAVAKSLFADTVFGPDVNEGANDPLYVLGSIFDAFTNYFPLFRPVKALSQGITKLLKTIRKAAEANTDFQIGDQPDVDAGPFVTSVGNSFTSTRAELRGQMSRWMGTGTITSDVHSSPEDTLSFFGSGSVLNSFSRSIPDMRVEAQNNILQQLGISIVAGMWNGQGATVKVFDDMNLCGPILLLPPFPPNFDQNKEFPRIPAPNFPGGPKCIGLFEGHQVSKNFKQTLGNFHLDVENVAINAAVCAQNGLGGIFPPAEDDVNVDGGLPRCTFPLILKSD